MWALSLAALLLAAPPGRADVVYCDQDTVARPVFKRPRATHFVVADFRPRSERAEDLEMGRTAANAVDQVLRDHMLRVALEGEEGLDLERVAEQLEVHRLKCVVKDATAALALGKALGADLLLWGDAVCPLRAAQGQPLVHIVNTIEARDHARIQTGPIETHVTLPKPEVGSFCAHAALTARGRPLLSSAQDEPRSAEVLEVGHLELPQVVSGDALGLTLFVGGLTFYERQDYPRALRLFRRAAQSLRTDSASASELLRVMGFTELRAGHLDTSAEYFSRCDVLAKKGSDSDWSCRLMLLESYSLASDVSRIEGLAQELLQYSRESANRGLEAYLRMRLGDLAQRVSQPEEARARYDEALELFRSLGDTLGVATTLKSLGTLAQSLSAVKEARARFAEALPLFEALGDSLGVATTLLRLGALAQNVSEVKEARARYDAALPLFRGLGNRLGEANTLMSLGELAQNMSEVKEARARYDAALRLFQEIGNRRGEANTLMRLGLLAQQESEPDKARARYDAALPLFRAVGDGFGEANTLVGLGDLARSVSEPGEARARYDAALRLFQTVGDTLGRANTLKSQGDLARGMADVKEARARYEEALPLFQAVSDRSGEAHTLQALALLADDAGDGPGFDTWCAQALEAFSRLKYRAGAAHQDWLQGIRFARHGDPHRARQALTRAHRTVVELGRKDVAAELMKTLAALDARPSRP